MRRDISDKEELLLIHAPGKTYAASRSLRARFHRGFEKKIENNLNALRKEVKKFRDGFSTQGGFHGGSDGFNRRSS